MQNIRHRFNKFAQTITIGAGSPFTFAIAVLGILGWVVAGFFVGFANTTFELSINSITTVITFLMVFIIQSTQNRDSAALHLKMDELIMSNEKARNVLMRAESMTDEEVKELREGFRKMEDKMNDGS